MLTHVVGTALHEAHRELGDLIFCSCHNFSSVSVPLPCFLWNGTNNSSGHWVRCKISFQAGRDVWKRNRKAVLVCSLFQPTLFLLNIVNSFTLLVDIFFKFLQTDKLWGHINQVLGPPRFFLPTFHRRSVLYAGTLLVGFPPGKTDFCFPVLRRSLA